MPKQLGWCDTEKIELVSDKTIAYLESLLRDGDDVNYFVWLRRVRQEETRAQVENAKRSSRPDAVFDKSSIRTPPSSTTSAKRISRFMQPLPERHRKTAMAVRTNPLLERLQRASNAWDDLQESRKRNAPYRYLTAVYAVVMRYKRRGKTEKLLRRAFKFVGNPFDRSADPFATVIRCTSGRSLDNKTISKWARALRYAAYRDRPARLLRSFMKALGGINACADRHAKQLGRGGRRAERGRA